MKRLAALSVLVVLILVWSVKPVAAQVDSSTPTPVVTPPPISLDAGGLSIEEFNKQLDALQTTYRNQLTTYRTDEKAFQIAKEQYYQIQTLAALEEAVRDTRQVMLTRVDVLETYLSIARLTLQNTKGIDTTVKADALQQIEVLAGDLKTHRQSVAAAADRTALLSAAVQFVSLNTRVTLISKRITNLVGYGNLQTVDDKMTSIKQELQQQIETTETDPLVLAQKKRGLDEVQRNLDQVNTFLVKSRAAINLANSTSNFSTYKPTSDFSSIFGGLSRSLAYLQELVKN